MLSATDTPTTAHHATTPARIAAVHAFLDGPHLRLWCETDRPAEWAPGRPGRRKAHPPARPHPYAASHDELGAERALRAFGSHLVVFDVELPSVSRIPMPSATAVEQGRPAPRGTARPAPWSVPGLAFATTAGTFDALRSLKDASVPLAPSARALAATLATLEDLHVVDVDPDTALRWVLAHPLLYTTPAVADDPAVLETIRTAWPALREAHPLAGWRPPVPAPPLCMDWQVQVRLSEAGTAAPPVDAAPDPTAAAPAERRWAVGLHLIGADGRTLAAEEVGRLVPGETDAATEVLYQATDRLVKLHPELNGLGTSQVLVGDGALLALVDATSLLGRRGVTVALPRSVAQAERIALDMKAGFSPTAAGNFGLDALATCAWSAEVDGARLDATALGSVLSLRQRLVATGDGFVVLSRAQLKRLRQTLAKDKVASVLGVAEGEDLGDGVQVRSVELSGVLARIAALPTATLEDPDLGGYFCGTLHGYQRDEVARALFLSRYGLGLLVFDEMGLGKTVTALACVAADMAARARGDGNPPPTLAVVPTSVLSQWQREAKRFVPKANVVVHYGPMGKEAAAQSAEHADLVLTTHATLRNERQYFERRWARLVIDEAHEARNPRTGLHSALASLPADQVVCMTGTPVHNGLADFHTVCSLALPGFLGSGPDFRARFGRAIAEGTDDGEILARILAPFVVANTKQSAGEVCDLPPLVADEVAVELTAEQQRLYETAVDDLSRQHEEAATEFGRQAVILRLIMLLKQICAHPLVVSAADEERIFGRSAKFDACVERVAERADTGHRTLVFTQFRRVIDLLAQGIGQRVGHDKVAVLHGGTSVKERTVLQDRLAAGELVCLVISVRAGGTGLNLVGADEVIHYDRWWNPAVTDQATARSHRQGQRQAVTVTSFVCEGTIERRIDESADKKRTLASRLFEVVGDGRLARELASLDTASLRETFALAHHELA